MFSGDRKSTWLFGVVGIGAIAGLLSLEVLTEEDGVSPLEFLLEALELVLTLAAAGAITLVFARMQAHHAEKVALIRDLEAARIEGVGLRQQMRSHLDGIGVAIEKQFVAWGLTDAEREVGRTMLKGLSHKEIATLRGTSEATVRQQATRIYQRSGLGGRAAFCAYFLEDLLAPDSTRTSTKPGGV